MPYREIIAVCAEIHTKHINTLCGLNVEFVKLVQLTVKHTRNKIKHSYFILGNSELHVSAHESHHQTYKYGTIKMEDVQLSYTSRSRVWNLNFVYVCILSGAGVQ
jgi:hypothetical protein